MRSDRTIVVVWLVLVLVAAAYEAIVGLDLVEFSNNPTEGAPGATGLLVVAIGAVGLGGLLFFVAGLNAAATRRLTQVREVALVPVAAAMLLLYHHISDDPTYAPSLERFSHSGAAPTAAVIVTCLVDVVAAGLLVARRDRIGLLVGGAGLMVTAALTFFAGG